MRRPGFGRGEAAGGGVRAQTFVAAVGLTVVAIVPARLAAQTAADDSTVCARCHESPSVQVAVTGGHAAGLACTDCHRDRRPGRVGRRHRATARCASHHGEEIRHPPRERAVRATRSCLVCHDPHGSPNQSLVRAQLAIRRLRLSTVHFTNDSGAASGGFTDPGTPGAGLCEVCHRQTDVFRADGRGQPHFTDRCVLCHDHASGFRPVVTDENCTVCHTTEGARFAKPSLHATGFACSGCHAERDASPGPGHRSVAACADCHDRRTHAPPASGPFACTHCHDAHGTDNAKLVLETIRTPQGEDRPIRFQTLAGRRDESFASASAPGTGVCEVCHTTTRYYRADGSGEPHFTFSCLPCHLHADGFAPG
jgi:predicted CXXCH cytochrome family protein